MKEEEKQAQPQMQPPATPKVDAKFVAKQYAIGYGARWLTNIVIAVPILLIWVAFYFLVIKTGWILNLNSSVRGILVIGVLAVPLVIAAFVRSKLRDFFTEKFGR